MPTKLQVLNDEAYALNRSQKQEGEPPRYIAIEGPIGVGKSTLTELLALRLRGEMVMERFEENPFLTTFYDDRRRNAFQTQIFFLLSRYRQQQELFQTDLFYTSVVSDYIFAKDRIFASVNLSDNELKLYDQIQHALDKTVPTPDVVIYMQAGVTKLEENIRRRGRAYERKITREYLGQIVEAYNDFFFHYRETRLIVVDTARMDFLDNPKNLDELLRAINRFPHPPVEYLSPVHDALFPV